MTPLVLDTIAGMRAFSAQVRAAGETLGFVPTMGALHDGHATLIERARAGAHRVVVSIFVNPLQFDRADDLARYPRTMDDDARLCARLGVDAIFAPSAAEMYPRPPACTVTVGPLGAHLCGAHRPGHFDGVATVVAKLFGIVTPHRAWFGEKDAQQLAIIRRLVQDLDIPVDIVGVPTVREADGLAMSSRNRHLSGTERVEALALCRALDSVARQVAAGATDAAAIRSTAAATIPSSPVLRLEYLEIVDPDDLDPVTTISTRVLVAGALWVGGTRLIDNLTITPPEAGSSHA